MGSVVRIAIDAEAIAFGAGQRHVLLRIAEGAPLSESLDSIVRLSERHNERTMCAILLEDELSHTLRHVAAPNLPPEYVLALDGLAVGLEAGSFGAAMQRRERVIVEDIRTHPYWSKHAALASAHGLAACWALPLFGRAGKVLGAFAVYYREPRTPTKAEEESVEVVASLASLAIVHEREQAARERLTSELSHRVRQLTVLHRVTRLLQSELALGNGLFTALVSLLPEAFRFPERCVVRIQWGQCDAVSGSVREPAQRVQVGFGAHQSRGTLEVACASTSERATDLFLPGEHELVSTVGELVSARIARDESESALRRSEQRLRATVDHTPNVAMQWYDAEGRVVYCNPATEQLFGWDANAASGKRLSELNFSEREEMRFMDRLREAAATGLPQGPIELEYQRPDGGRGLLLSTVFKIPLGSGDDCYACTDVDLTERRRFEAVLREREQLLTTIFGTAYDGLALLAVEGPERYRFTIVNDAYLESLGLPHAAVMGKLHEEVVPAATHQRAVAAFREAIETGGPLSYENYGTFPAGDRWGEITVTPLTDGAGHCTHIVGCVHDITARRQAEEERWRLERELLNAERTRTLGALARGIAHDFNNILMGIAGHALLATQELPQSHAARENLEEISKATRRAAELVRGILTYSRHYEPHREPIDVRPVITEAANLARSGLPPRVKLELELSARTPIVLADPTQVHQVMM
ncbi:MAG TPA: PAS domain-containing protein, partial [Polyangiaceae bacterium]|nr:PAS domain-containing protein [Polyangiaceae bacterium]